MHITNSEIVARIRYHMPAGMLYLGEVITDEGSITIRFTYIDQANAQVGAEVCEDVRHDLSMPADITWEVTGGEVAYTMTLV